jgi:hypothetical protein
MTEPKKKMRKLLPVAIIGIMAFFLTALMLMLVLDSFTERAMDDRQEDLTRLMSVNKLETVEERAAVVEAMLAEPRMKQYAAAWSMQMSNYERQGKYEPRDNVFFEALEYLDPQQMAMFLRVNKEYIVGFSREAVQAEKAAGRELPPIIIMSSRTRALLHQCNEDLSAQVKSKTTRKKSEKNSISDQVLARMLLLYSDMFFVPCNLRRL